jgi:hypothetical protein
MGATLTYEEFKEKARAAGGTERFYPRHPDNPELEALMDSGELFSVRWIAGGMHGGDCWGARPYRMDPDPEPDIEALDTLLEEIGVSLKEGRQLLGMFERGDYEDGGYYGNYTDYSYKFVSYATIYDKLVEFGYALPREEAPTP